MRALICSSQPLARRSIMTPSGPLNFRLTLLLPGHSVQLAASSVPDAFRAGVGGHPTELGQTENILVELGRLHRVLGRQRDVFDPCHCPFLSPLPEPLGSQAYRLSPSFSHTPRGPSSARERGLAAHAAPYAHASR